MKPSVETPLPPKQGWTYVRLTVVDGARQIKPAEVAFDRLCFREPPHLVSSQIEIILVNGDQEQRHTAIVLPHDAEATRIPIQLIAG